MKTLEDDWYIVIKTCLLFLRLWEILSHITCPCYPTYIQSTNSMIWFNPYQGYSYTVTIETPMVKVSFYLNGEGKGAKVANSSGLWCQVQSNKVK